VWPVFPTARLSAGIHRDGTKRHGFRQRRKVLLALGALTASWTADCAGGGRCVSSGHPADPGGLDNGWKTYDGTEWTQRALGACGGGLRTGTRCPSARGLNLPLRVTDDRSDGGVRIVGPQGPQGEQGPQGVQGPRGEQVSRAAGHPGHSGISGRQGPAGSRPARGRRAGGPGDAGRTGARGTRAVLHGAGLYRRCSLADQSSPPAGGTLRVGTASDNDIYIWDEDSEAGESRAAAGTGGSPGPQGSRAAGRDRPAGHSGHPGRSGAAGRPGDPGELGPQGDPTRSTQDGDKRQLAARTWR
jgi:hypothetical protein